MMVSVLEKYLQQIRDATNGSGVYAFRGQSCADWPLHSAATRRLVKSMGLNSLNGPSFPEVYIHYHRETLIGPARTHGFGIESGREISDLQLLAKLQHFGAATCLLDFSWNSLVALWFACREPNGDAKLFIVDTRGSQVANQSNQDDEQSVEKILSRRANDPRLLLWEPMWTGDAMLRILRQRSVFIVDRPGIAEGSDPIQKIVIAKSHKDQILKELETVDISESSLIVDIYGFSQLNGADSLIQIEEPLSHFRRGKDHFDNRRFLEAIYEFDRCIELNPNIGDLYLSRGNAKSELDRYGEAIQDYERAVTNKNQPYIDVPNSTSEDVHEMLYQVHYNWGNVLAILGDHENALKHYNEAVSIAETGGRIPFSKELVVFNRGNVYTDMEKLEKAIDDYDTLTNPAGTLYNKANALVILGRFKDAIECYRQAEQTGVDGPDATYNRSIIEEIVKLVDTREHEHNYQKDPESEKWYVTVKVADEVDSVGDPFVIKGRIGNTGGFPGGKGFPGKAEVTIRIATADK